MPVTDKYKIEFNSPDPDKIKKLLVNEYEFSEERVKNTLEKLDAAKKLNEQKGLSEFFG